MKFGADIQAVEDKYGAWPKHQEKGRMTAGT